MNEYNFEVNFEKGKINTNLRRLVQNDYNSTKINFTFDKEGRVLFKMLYPNKTEYITQVENNELIFGAGILTQEGDYEVEISLYTEDGRLTDYATKSFEVRKELIDTDELIEVDDRVPVLDNLINEVNSIKKDVENGKYNGKDGANGADGENGITPTIGENGNWFIGGEDTGLPSRGKQGIPGETGLQGIQGKDGLNAYEVYLKNGGDLSETEWLESLKGEDGERGPQGEIGPKGDTGEKGEDGKNPILGEDYFTETDKIEIKNYCNSYIDNQLGTINEQLATLTEVSE